MANNDTRGRRVVDSKPVVRAPIDEYGFHGAGNERKLLCGAVPLILTVLSVKETQCLIKAPPIFGYKITVLMAVKILAEK